MATIRIKTYRPIRVNYGSRTFEPKEHICNADFLCKQRDGSYLFELNESKADFPIGHKIAVGEKDIINLKTFSKE